MQAWFDKQQELLASMIDDPSQNTVGHFTKQIYGFANGGLAGEDPTLASSADTSDMNFAQRAIAAGQKSVNGPDSQAAGKYGESPLGQGFYNSPAYIAGHFTQLGKFFSGAEPGNKYTDRYTQPIQKDKTLQAEDPNTFYAKWYEGQRRFAEAEEVASRGQTTSRTR